jgi:putative OmpL-like beta-barrel porin-2
MLRNLFVAFLATCAWLVSSSQIASVGTDTARNINETPDQEKQPLLTITGSADVYYKYDFAKTKANTFTSFTNTHNSFALGMASVKFEHKGEKVGAVLDLGFGQRAKEFSYTDEGIMQAVKQLYVSYSPVDWLKFTAGTWATHVGYELLDPQLNRNYSMSYMFTNGPFSHTGLKADATKGKHSFMLGVSNATDYRTPPEGFINKKFMLAQYGFSPNEKIKIYVNYVGGKAPDTSKINQFDAVVTAKINDQFNIGYNGTIASVQAWDGTKNLSSKDWWGSAVYLNYDPVSWFGVTLREEYFNDKNYLKLTMSPAGCTMVASTLSANFKIGGLIIIPEFRYDHSSEKMFVDKNGSAVSSASNVLLAAVYSF